MLDFGFYNMDCMKGMAQFPDKYFDLAVVDPPYGIGCMSMTYTTSGAVRTHGHAAAKRRDYRKQQKWDIRPSEEYFTELFRISRKQIIWGAITFLIIYRLQEVSWYGTKERKIIWQMILLIVKWPGCLKAWELHAYFGIYGMACSRVI